MDNSLLSLLVLLSAIYFVTAQQKANFSIGQGSSLTPTGNSSWLSPSGLFAFGFYLQGNNRYRVGIFFAGLAVNKTVVWTANRDDPPVSDDVTLRLNIDGRLVLQHKSQDSTTDIVSPDQSISSASMLDNGNFVLYDSNQKMIWQSFDHPTDAIVPGQILSENQELFSSMSESDYSTGLFRLKMQSDSNLVQYPVQTIDSGQYSYWNTGTFGKGGVNVTLNLDPDGHLYLLNNSVTILQNLTSGSSDTRRLYLMKIDFDGILRLYSFTLDMKGASSSIVWQPPVDRCAPKGICGLNGYCVLYDNEPKCECPPGFDYVSPGNWTAGCHQRVYTADSCKNKERRNQYSMRALENTWWENVPYSNFVLDSGNFVLYDSNQEVMWQSFDHPTDTILPGQILSQEQQLFSSRSNSDYSTGIFRLKMQSDSNLVQYPVQTADTAQYSYWSTATYGRGGVNVTLNLDPDGHLYLWNNSVTILKNLTSGSSDTRRLYLVKIDFDGILRLYSFSLDKRGNNSSIVWRSSGDKCDPKGLCGLNGFCTINDNEAKCVCPPGFDYVSLGNWTAGCKRNYTAEICNNNEQRNPYSMRALENTWWENVPYSVLNLKVKEECETACLDDCNCEAAFFVVGECRKQRLPLRYGRRLLTDSTITYIKVSSSTPAIQAPSNPTTSKKKEHHLGILLIGIALLALAFTVFIISGFVAYRNRVWAYKKISPKGNFELMDDIAPRSFTYAELEQVTNGFQEEIGRGASGTVYKGTLEYNNKVVAVKRLENMLAQGEKEFQNEIKVIGRTHHRNLVRLLGYSLDGPKKLLVYEYMVNGSLADVLFDPENPPRWDERIRIALDIARGILYLHEECETQIIHCDVKPQNVLIDEYRSAKVSDFGLAKLLKADQSNTYTGIRGTRGYVAPEWHRNMAITVKADVYSFGIMLLEIICCRKCVILSLSEEEAVLEEWVNQCFENNELDKLIIDAETDKKKFERMVRVGLWCILDEPSLRPSMKKVLLMLEGTVDIPAPPSLSSYLTAI